MTVQVLPESPSALVASVLLKSCDSFERANSFNAVGKNVLVAFLGSFLKLEISTAEETTSTLKHLN
jgi:hypothetical protein